MDSSTIYPEHVNRRTPPANLHPEDEWLVSHELERVIPESHLYCFNDVVAVQDHIFGHRELPQITHPKGLSKKDILVRLGFSCLTVTGRKTSGLWITDNWSYGYFHWLLDCLPRLVSSEELLPKGEPILLPSGLSKFQFVGDSLKSLRASFEFLPPMKKVFIKKLWIPGQLARSGNYVSESLQKLRRKLHVESTAPGKKRLYISRQRSRRKISNSLEVETVLRAFGFEEVFMEDLSFNEQVLLMQHAEIICGIHGAGLANALFAPSGTAMVELRRTGDDWNNCYFSLASDLNMPYFYLTGEGASDHTLDADIRISPEELSSLLTLVVNRLS